MFFSSITFQKLSTLLLVFLGVSCCTSVAMAFGGENLPRKLSELDLFSDLKNMAPRAELIAYDVNSPLWSDGAKKNRWVFLPKGQSIRYEPESKTDYPVGTIFVKHFEFGKKIETRIEFFSQTK